MSNWEIFYYKDSKGSEPVKDFIEKQRLKDQVKIFDWISRLEELGPKAIRPLVEYLGQEIYELRIKLSDTETRILYFYLHRNYIILTNAWNKKKAASSKSEYKKHIDKALKCKNDYENRVKDRGDLL